MALAAVILATGCAKRTVADKRSSVTPCAVHNVTLIEKTIPNHKLYSIEYELTFHEAMLAHFPNLGDSFGERDKSITHILYNYCPKCAEACQDYSKENP